MGRLTKEEIQQLRNSLEQSGLTFKQLQDELLDHLICDIERYMAEGLTFRHAWQKVDEEIPNNQFKNIQTETMEIVKKKNGLIDGMTMLSLLLLIGATLFKMLHWQGADILLIAGLASICLTILVSVFKGFYISPAKKGGFIVLLMGLFFMSFIISIFFQILHWKGAIAFRYFSVIGLALLFPALSIYFYRSKQAARDHPVLRLIEQNRTKIDRILLSLVVLGIAFKIPAFLQTNPSDFAPFLFPVLTIFGVGLYMFTFTWRPYITALPEKQGKALGLLLIASIVAFVLFMLPIMHWVLAFPEKVRIIMSLSFYILVATIVLTYYLYYSQDKQRNLLAFFSFLILLIPLLRLGVDMGILSGTSAGFISESIYNIGVLFGLILLLIVFYKKTVFRAFMLLMLAHYTLSYPVA